MEDNSDSILVKGQAPIVHWTRGVEFEQAARSQLMNIAQLPFIHDHVAVMPDVHMGIGATVGSVIPTKGAIVPAAVGVDIGCGMHAIELGVKASALPDNLSQLRAAIELAVPHGFSSENKGHSKGCFENAPSAAAKVWRDKLSADYARIIVRNPQVVHDTVVNQIGTLGGGNHFIEVCLDTEDGVWIMLHSGSRGVGNRIGSYFIAEAKRMMERNNIHLPDRDLAYLVEDSDMFDAYWTALDWAQRYARLNRDVMLDAVVAAFDRHVPLPDKRVGRRAVACHHNYVSRERHYGEDVMVTRKGAVSAKKGELGIIPGSMGARSFIVRGLGNPKSFCSCSHGAGRRMSRGEAKRRFSLEDHAAAVAGVECRRDEGVIDETPGAYKDIDACIAAQSDLVEVVATLKQVLCVKG